MERNAPQEAVIPLVSSLIHVKARKLCQVTSLQMGLGEGGALPTQPQKVSQQASILGQRRKQYQNLTAANNHGKSFSAECIPPREWKESGMKLWSGRKTFLLGTLQEGQCCLFPGSPPCSLCEPSIEATRHEMWMFFWTLFHPPRADATGHHLLLHKIIRQELRHSVLQKGFPGFC